MAATFSWAETNGAVSPPAGETLARGEMNWKNIDDSTTAYTSSPVSAGSNSYDKFQYGKFTSTWNTITNCKFDQTSNTTLGTGLTLYASKTMGAVGDRCSYRTPTTGAHLTNATAITYNASFPTGARVLYLSKTSPDDGSCTTSITGGGIGYTQYIYTKVETTGSAVAGDSGSITFTLQYDES